LEIPFHSRWRHFAVDGDDRWMTIAATARWPSVAARARAEFDLAIISVLLDAGAGATWRYRDDVTGRNVGRSEGLALASLAMFGGGLLSAKMSDSLRVDAIKLERLRSAEVVAGLQAGPENPLLGIEGRIDLLRRLGGVVLDAPTVFARNDEPRPGGLF